MNDKLPIYGFMHCCAINDYKMIIDEQINKIAISGLYHACKRISIGVVGEYDTCFWKKLPRKYHVDYKSPDIDKYEFPTLDLLYKRCLKEDCLTWYIHTKGVANRRSHAKKWRNEMESSVINKWKICVDILKKFNKDTCGYGLSVGTRIRYLHYSGNFWWAKNDYIKKRPSPMTMNIKDRFDAERWILGKNECRFPIDINKFIRTIDI